MHGGTDVWPPLLATIVVVANFMLLFHHLFMLQLPLSYEEEGKRFFFNKTKEGIH